MSRDLRSLLVGFFGAIAGLLVALVVLSQFSDYRAESELSGWLNEVEPAQAAIASRALRNGTVDGSGEGVALPPIHFRPPAYYRITRDGTILMRGGRDGQFVALVPALAAGAVTWQCIGGSKDSVLMWCDDPALPAHATPEAAAR